MGGSSGTRGHGERSKGEEGENSFRHAREYARAVLGDRRHVPIRRSARERAAGARERSNRKRSIRTKLSSGDAFTRFPRRWVADTTTAAFAVADVRVGSGDTPECGTDPDPGRSTALLFSSRLARKCQDNWNTCARWRGRQRGEGLGKPRLNLKGDVTGIWRPGTAVTIPRGQSDLGKEEPWLHRPYGKPEAFDKGEIWRERHNTHSGVNRSPASPREEALGSDHQSHIIPLPPMSCITGIKKKGKKKQMENDQRPSWMGKSEPTLYKDHVDPHSSTQQPMTISIESDRRQLSVKKFVGVRVRLRYSKSLFKKVVECNQAYV